MLLHRPPGPGAAAALTSLHQPTSVRLPRLVPILELPTPPLFYPEGELLGACLPSPRGASRKGRHTAGSTLLNGPESPQQNHLNMCLNALSGWGPRKQHFNKVPQVTLKCENRRH